MRPLMTAAAALVAIGLIANVTFAHGGAYPGPTGVGEPTNDGPPGERTIPGPGNPNSGPTGCPTTPKPRGNTPVRPGDGRSGGGIGCLTSGPKKNTGPSLTSWDVWWDYNGGRFYRSVHQERRLRESAEAMGGVHCAMGGEHPPTPAFLARCVADEIGREAIPTLLLALKDPYYDARAGALIALGKVGDAEQADVIEAIRGLLKDPARQVQESACLALGILGAKQAIPDLLEICKNTPKGQALAAGTGTGDVLTRTRAFAAMGIGMIGTRQDLDSEVVAELIALTTKKSAQIDEQVGAAIALQLLRTHEAVPQLIEIFNDDAENRYVRAHIGVALGKIGAKQAVGTLLEGLENKVNVLQYSSAISLGLLTEKDDATTVARLIRHAQSAPDRATRNFCIIALGEIGHPKGQEFLIRLAKTRKSDDQAFACIALGIMGFRHAENKTEVGQEILSLYERERNDSQKSAMAIALGLLHYEPARKVLRKDLVGPGNASLKTYVVTALGLLADKDAFPIISDLVSQRSGVALRKQAATALGLLRDSSSVETFQKVIEESGNSKAVLGAATVALGFIADRRVVPILKDFVEDPKKTHQDVTRAFATVALGYLGDKDDIPLLSLIHENSNYLADTDALWEVRSIL